ncbi:MAG: YceI family protein [Phycisphaerales bacterium]|nr:YceI family protein [Phycisphaerales bacterium]
MNNKLTKGIIATFLIGLSGIALAAIAPEPVLEPAVPKEIAADGVVYHTITGKQTQVTFTSKAPLENIVGKSNSVVGYAVAAQGETPAKLVGAKWVLPVESLATGLPMRDEHLYHEWLESGSFPTIEFTLTSTEDIKLVKSGDGFTTWTLTLIGDMTLHGQTKSIRVEKAKLSFLTASEKTAKIADGDLCFLKCTYSIKMSDFDIHHKDVPDKVSDEIKLVQMLRMTTVQD